MPRAYNLATIPAEIWTMLKELLQLVNPDFGEALVRLCDRDLRDVEDILSCKDVHGVNKGTCQVDPKV